MTDAAVARPAGWYPDEANDRRERWWSGSEWTRYTAKAPAPNSLTPPAMWRALRVGANRVLLLGCPLLLVSVTLVLVNMVIVLVTIPAAPSSSIQTLMVVLFIVSLALIPPVVVLCIIGLGRSARLGARTYAIYCLVFAPIIAAIAPLPLLLVGLVTAVF